VLTALTATFALAVVGTVVALQLADHAAGVVVPLLTGLGLWAPRDDLLPQPPARLGASVLLLVARACGVAVIAAAIALVAIVLARSLAARWRPLLLLGAVFVDLSMFGWRYLHEPLPIAPGVPFGPPTAQFTAFLGPDNVQRLQQLDGVWRVAPLGREASIAGNAGYLLGVPLAVGLDPLLPRRYAELVADLNDEPVAAFENLVVYVRDRPSRLAPLLGARYRLVPQDDRAASATPHFAVEEDLGTLPRVFAVETVRAVASPEESRSALAAPAFEPAREAVLEMDPSAVPPAPPGSGGGLGARAELRRYASGAVDVEATLPTGGAVVLLDAWHPGWTATMAGHPIPVFPADHAFVGVVLPPGTHAIQFRFDPASWRAGLAIAAATLLLLSTATAVGLWRAGTRRGQARRPLGRAR
jgi:hypothetical protein